MTWGLVEAYNGNTLLDADEIEKDPYILYREPIRLFISPVAAAMEHSLGFSFAGRAESLFGEPIAGEWPQVFVLMPFTADLKPIFEDHIKRVAKAAGLKAGRADDFFSSRSVVSEIWSAICAASVIVADCTGRNPNVFYEIGVAHTVGKDTILISQHLEDVPFDLRHLRVIIYEYTPRGMDVFEEKLRATLGGLRPKTAGAKRQPRRRSHE